jgi:hypothetical protein
MTRAKFVVLSIKKNSSDPLAAQVELGAVYSSVPGSENKAFWQATPSGKIEMYINNPEGAKLFELGEEYYVDFSPAPKSKL